MLQIIALHFIYEIQVTPINLADRICVSENSLKNSLKYDQPSLLVPLVSVLVLQIVRQPLIRNIHTQKISM